MSRQGLKYTYLSKLKLKSDGIGGQGAAKVSKRRKQVLKQGTPFSSRPFASTKQVLLSSAQIKMKQENNFCRIMMSTCYSKVSIQQNVGLGQ